MSNKQTQSCPSSQFHRSSSSINLKLYHILLAVAVAFIAQADGFSPDSNEVPATPSTTTSPSSFQSGSQSSFKCSDLPVRDQRKYCTNTTGFRHVLIDAEKYVQEECKFQFRHHKWRCYGVSLLHQSNITKTASQESSFVYSIISAMLTHTIADACDKGRMSCSSFNGGIEVEQIDSFNHTIISNSHVLFGMTLAERFLNSKEQYKQGLTARHRLNRHNNNIGWQIVNNTTKPVCQCHSASNGCTVRTCKATLLFRREISALVKQKYDTAVRVRASRDGSTLVPYTTSAQSTTSIRRTDMVFFQKSPDYCFQDLSIGSLGVSGQECNPHSTQADSCQDSCCGRGFVTEDITYVTDCCAFAWCCWVECKKCNKTYESHRCK